MPILSSGSVTSLAWSQYKQSGEHRKYNIPRENDEEQSDADLCRITGNLQLESIQFNSDRGNTKFYIIMKTAIRL